MNQRNLLLLITLVVRGNGYVIKDNTLINQLRQVAYTNDVHSLSHDYDSRATNLLSNMTLSKAGMLQNVVQLANMLTCVTGRSGMDYNNYGCYCGLGGKGTPVDGVDRCCETHDQCYDTVEKQNCRLLNLPHLVVYKYECTEGGKTTCYDKPGSCNRMTCDCDRDLAMCLSKATYNGKYKNYPSRKC